MTTGQTGKRWKWPQIIQALLTTHTHAQAAAQAGVSERTVLRLTQNPLFMEEFSQERTALLRSGTNTLLLEQNEAAKTLVTLSKDSKTPVGSRIQASVKIIELGREGYQSEELEQRLLALERNQKEDQ